MITKYTNTSSHFYCSVSIGSTEQHEYNNSLEIKQGSQEKNTKMKEQTIGEIETDQ